MKSAAAVTTRTLSLSHRGWWRADGVGGATAGELASRLAVLKMIGLDARRLANTLEEEFSAAVVDANDVIGFATYYNPSLAGMATTLTAIVISNDGDYLVANIGDSRTYLLRERGYGN